MAQREPAALSTPQADAWEVMLPTLQILPGALDTQMQRHHGLTFAGYLTLSTLEASPRRALRMRLLAARASMSMSRLSHLADRLEKSGYIERHPVPDDRRSTLAVLTDAGMAKVLEARPTEARTVQELVFAKLSADQVTGLKEMFAAISSRMDPEDRGPRARS